MQKSATRNILTTICLLILGGGSYYAVTQHYKPDPGQSMYLTARVELGVVKREINVLGTITSKNQIEIGTEVSGRIQTVEVRDNQRVSVNQVLAKIDADQFENSVSKARALVLQAEAEKNRQTATIEILEAQVARRRSASSELAFSAEAIEKLEYDLRIAQSDLKSKDSALLLAKADLMEAELKLGKTIIRSPIDGYVLQTKVEAGQTVNSSLETPVLFTVASDLSVIEINVNVDEVDISKIKKGMRTSFRAESYPEYRFQAEVSDVKKVPAEGLNYVAYPVVLHATNEDEILYPGMTANVHFNLVKPIQNALRIPVDATRYRHTEFKPAIPEVLKKRHPKEAWEAAAFGYDLGRLAKEGLVRVFVQKDDGSIEAREIEIGAANRRFAQVLSGDLKANEKVILGLRNQNDPN